jgi:Rieske 2Fe-2S protein
MDTAERHAQEIDFVHTGPATIAGRYLRRFWQPIYLSRDLATGTSVPIRVMGEDFTLYRGESGRPYVTVHRCPHRSTFERITNPRLQDTVICVGQGAIADRSAERLGTSDRVWNRELRLLAEAGRSHNSPSRGSSKLRARSSGSTPLRIPAFSRIRPP